MEEKQILMDDKINYNLLSDQEGSYVLSFLLSTKEVKDSYFTNEEAKVLKAYLRKESDDTVYFSLVLSYSNEESLYTGEVLLVNINKVYIIGLITRMKNNEEIEVYDTFNSTKKGIVRHTIYQSVKNTFDVSLSLPTKEDINEFKKNIINSK
ncbi:MAG: hypothetical protein RR228_03485 [Bacilli bacterium]